MVAEGVVGELGDQAMVLVQVGAIVGKDERRVVIPLQSLEGLFDFRMLRGKKAVAKAMYRHRGGGELRQERARGRFGFAAAGTLAAEHDPAHAHLRMLRG